MKTACGKSMQVCLRNSKEAGRIGVAGGEGVADEVELCKIRR